MHPYAYDLSPLVDIHFHYDAYPFPEELHNNGGDDLFHDGDDAVSGTSPLPLCMDWSPPPPNWDGPNTLWPHTLSSWTFSSTIPSWSLVPQSAPSSEPVVFFRVQVGVRSPQAITTTRIILRRFSDFLDLFSQVVTFAKKSEIEVEAFSEFGVLVEKLLQILNELSDTSTVLDKMSIRKSLESLQNVLRRARILTKSLNLRHPVKQIEDMTHDIGWSLGVLLVASLEVSIDFREQIGILQRQMMNARFDGISSMTSSPKSELFANEINTVGEIEEEIIDVSIGDVVLQLKSGNDEEFAVSLLRLKEFMRSEKLDSGLINEEATLSILFTRLSSCKADNRLAIIQLLRRIAFGNDEKKENMVEVEFLSAVVKSLTRDSEERREAVGLFLDI